MTISLTDISYVHSKAVTDLSTNGGRMGESLVISGAKHSLFPRITQADRTAGITRYRKMFWKNANASDEPAYGVLQWMETPSNAGDRFYFSEGSQDDTQADLVDVANIIFWGGVGSLNTALSGAETQVVLAMEANDFYFPNGGKLHISDKVMSAQTIAAVVATGDSVRLTGGTWERETATTDITHPLGCYLGDSKVLSLQTTTHEEWLSIAENLNEQAAGTGTGGVSPTIANAANGTNGICAQPDRLPILQSQTAASSVITIEFDGFGEVTSGASAGKLNMADGTWTTQPTWDTAPGTGKAISFVYRERAFSYSGNTVTVELDDQVSNSYTTASSHGSACVETALVKSSYEDFLVTTVGNGDFDDTTYPVVCYNDGAVYDTITLTFTSGSAYSASGTNIGSIGTGNTSSDFTGVHPDTSKNLFTIDSDGFSGVFATGDTISFKLLPASQGFWMKEIVPSGVAQEPHNLCVLGFYLE